MELDSWNKIVEKAVDAEAKAGLRPTSYVRKTDRRCPHGNRPAHTTTVKAQAPLMKNSRAKEPKARTQDVKSSASKRKRSDRIEHRATCVISRATTLIKMVTFRTLARSRQKTSIGLGDVRFGNWCW